MSKSAPFPDPNAFLWGLLLVFAIVVCLGIAGSIHANKKHKEELAARGCQLEHSEKTGKRIYCGKACYRDEIKKVYQCTTHRRVEIDGEVVEGK